MGVPHFEQKATAYASSIPSVILGSLRILLAEQRIMAPMQHASAITVKEPISSIFFISKPPFLNFVKLVLIMYHSQFDLSTQNIILIIKYQNDYTIIQ